jgi:hypothetical protein
VGSADKQSFQTSEGLLALLSADGREDRRREGRLKLRMPVTVEGVTNGDGYFRDKAVLEDISPHGAQCFMKRYLDVGSSILLIIDPDNTAHEISANVNRSIDHSGRYEIGVCF